MTGALKDVRRKISRYWAAEFINVRQRELAGLLNITKSAVSMAAGCGPGQTEELEMNFEIRRTDILMNVPYLLVKKIKRDTFFVSPFILVFGVLWFAAIFCLTIHYKPGPPCDKQDGPILKTAKRQTG